VPERGVRAQARDADDGLRLVQVLFELRVQVDRAEVFARDELRDLCGRGVDGDDGQVAHPESRLDAEGRERAHLRVRDAVAAEGQHDAEHLRGRRARQPRAQFGIDAGGGLRRGGRERERGEQRPEQLPESHVCTSQSVRLRPCL
jgi:hypothetical protein